jgi:hypothetical protein
MTPMSTASAAMVLSALESEPKSCGRELPSISEFMCDPRKCGIRQWG